MIVNKIATCNAGRPTADDPAVNVARQAPWMPGIIALRAGNFYISSESHPPATDKPPTGKRPQNKRAIKSAVAF